ncbi:MAG: ion channel [Betaproteobacteria bacterium]
MPTTDKSQKYDPFLKTTVLAASARGWDLYHKAVRMPWPGFLLLFSIGFLLLNAAFGALYMLGEHAITGAQPGSFSDHFFFSVQTIATIGYGAMGPASLYAHVLVTIEAMLGLLGVGLFAALAFARLSLPSARIRFSAVAVITHFDGVPTLMFRAANERRNSIIGARVEVNLLRQETTREGLKIRRFHDLQLLRCVTPMFALSWLVMHPLTQSSPLWGVTQEQLQTQTFALLVTITGLDETLSQTVHARHTYLNTDLRWNQRFVDMVQERGEGHRLVDLRLIDETEAAS